MAGNGQGYHYTLIKHGGAISAVILQVIIDGIMSEKERNFQARLELPYTIGQLLLLPLTTSPLESAGLWTAPDSQEQLVDVMISRFQTKTFFRLFQGREGKHIISLKDISKTSKLFFWATFVRRRRKEKRPPLLQSFKNNLELLRNFPKHWFSLSFWDRKWPALPAVMRENDGFLSVLLLPPSIRAWTMLRLLRSGKASEVTHCWTLYHHPNPGYA